MAKKYIVTRVMTVLQSTVLQADNEQDAIEKSRKLKLKEWSTLDNKRRKGYKAERVNYPQA